MAFIEQNLRKYAVTQTNDLIEARYSLALNEKRLLLLAISKINPDVYSGGDLEVQIDVDDWNQLYPSSNAYRELKKCADNLISKHIVFHESSSIRTKVNWVESINYDDDQSLIKLRFTKIIQTCLSGMLENFTQYQILSISKLNNIYAIRLYELLSQFKKSTKYRVINLEDLRFALDCLDKYPTTRKFKERVIKPAIKDINKLTDLKILNIDSIDIKKGRVITAFKFIYEDQPLSFIQSDLFKKI
jgi:plasmid replication initiation protein